MIKDDPTTLFWLHNSIRLPLRLPFSFHFSYNAFVTTINDHNYPSYDSFSYTRISIGDAESEDAALLFYPRVRFVNLTSRLLSSPCFWENNRMASARAGCRTFADCLAGCSNAVAILKKWK